MHLINFVLNGQESASNPLLLIHETVSGQAMTTTQQNDAKEKITYYGTDFNDNYFNIYGTIQLF